MIVRHKPEESVLWGHGTSDRLTTARDGYGYSVNDTVIWAGTESKLQYTNHVETVYCISGHGYVTEKDGTTHELHPGTTYILNDSDAHVLGAIEDTRVICVFEPALSGTEVHSLTADGFSGF